MRTIGNIIWIILGGAALFLEWSLVGILLCLTIIGIPLGKKCFQFAKFALLPFGKAVVNDGSGASMVLNLVWILFFGWEIALTAAVAGVAMLPTIVGIPFAWQSFKIAGFALFPFGSRVVDASALPS